MPCLSAYLRESLDFFKVGILQKIQTFGFGVPTPFDFLSLVARLRPHAPTSVLSTEGTYPLPVCLSRQGIRSAFRL